MSDYDETVQDYLISTGIWTQDTLPNADTRSDIMDLVFSLSPCYTGLKLRDRNAARPSLRDMRMGYSPYSSDVIEYLMKVFGCVDEDDFNEMNAADTERQLLPSCQRSVIKPSPTLTRDDTWEPGDWSWGWQGRSDGYRPGHDGP